MQSITKSLLERCQDAGVPCELVQGTRLMSEQEKIYTQGRTAPGRIVSRARPGDSFHNYGLAVDIVPKAYLTLPNWNPTGPLWLKIGSIGKGLGLEWGGDWNTPDYPHFQLNAAPLSELKAYWAKFKTIMPITVEPTKAGLVLMAGLAAVWFGFVRPKLKKARMLR